MLRDQLDNDVVNLVGSGAPTDGTSGTGANVSGIGSTYNDYTNKKMYYNAGTLASPVWQPLADSRLVRIATGQISAADIVATGAGKFGHAQGYPLVAAPGANIAVFPILCLISYDFITAAYTAGGNTTVNWDAGGAALTGLISAANSMAAASDKPFVLPVLSTVGIALVANSGLNLVTSVAFTQPGTAAGVINYKILYTTQNLLTAL